MRIETREDALREIMHILADHRQGKPVDFPQFLADLAGFMERENEVIEDLQEEVEDLKNKIEELENQEPPITYSDVEDIMEPLKWAKHDLEDFRNFMLSVKTELPGKLVKEIFSNLSGLEYDINSALDNIHCLIG